MSCTLRTFEMPASLSASRNARSGLGVRAQEADRLFAGRTDGRTDGRQLERRPAFAALPR